ncbi:hypothetical protein GCM10023322_69640 [Rugosimonospora acidiphila]|uniref:DUF4349 domain-containing protein n=2 Tax=Rugosimonospora acidiphila TaxID=556531 RepID=A0ABP9SNA3_9ACTN
MAAGSTACSGGASSSSGAARAGGAAKAPAQAAPAQGGGSGQDNGSGQAGSGQAGSGQGANAKAGAGANAQTVPGSLTGQVDGIQRSIIYTGSITVRVDSVDAAAAQLTTMAAAAGGFVGGDTRNLDAGHSTATLVLRIPAAKFGGVLDDIGDRLDGHEVSRKVTSDDVTETVIDLDARIQSQQASVDRVRALLAKAQSLSDITSIESQLTQRESDLESLEARKRDLADLTTLSTVTVSLLGPEAAVAKPEPKPEGGFWAGLTGGWHAFAGALRVLLLILGAVLPFAVVLGIPALVVLWLRRRRRVPPAAPDAPVA